MISPAPLAKAPLVVTLEDRFLTIEFAEPQACLSWAIVGGGKTLARRVVWHQVYNRELSPETDPVILLRDRLMARGTGTDCIVIASPPTGEEVVYAGKHTTPGHLIGRTVEAAIRSGIQQPPTR